MNKLATIYRATDNELINKRSIRPPYFDKRKSWCSFYDSFKSKSDIYVLFDGDKCEFSDYIESFEDINLQFLYCRSNQGSLLSCYNWARELKNEAIYFIEDDYLFLPTACDAALEGLELSKGNRLLVSTFDHLDRYQKTDDITYGREHILLSHNKQFLFRTAESTTGSIAMIRPYLDDLYKTLCEFNVNDRPFYRHILSLGYRLITSIPSQSTHVVFNDLAPTIDWENFSNLIYV